jgi:hypothetical protein
MDFNYNDFNNNDFEKCVMTKYYDWLEKHLDVLYEGNNRKINKFTNKIEYIEKNNTYCDDTNLKIFLFNNNKRNNDVNLSESAFFRANKAYRAYKKALFSYIKKVNKIKN